MADFPGIPEPPAPPQRRLPSVTCSARHDNGPDDIDLTLYPVANRGWQLAYLRVRFRESSGTAAMTLSLDSGAGEEYDVELEELAAKGVGADVNFTPPLDEAAAWQFQPGDGLHLDWTNPADVQWAVELGYFPL